MIITITSLRLRRLRYFFRLSHFGLKVSRQVKKQRGFIEMKNTGFGYWHYTATAWEKVEDMRNFARSGEHLAAMKSSRRLATEVRTLTFEAERMPGWKEAKDLIHRKGKIISFD